MKRDGTRTRTKTKTKTKTRAWKEIDSRLPERSFLCLFHFLFFIFFSPLMDHRLTRPRSVHSLWTRPLVVITSTPVGNSTSGTRQKTHRTTIFRNYVASRPFFLFFFSPVVGTVPVQATLYCTGSYLGTYSAIVFCVPAALHRGVTFFGDKLGPVIRSIPYIIKRESLP
jgi:hypothetical protein